MSTSIQRTLLGELTTHIVEEAGTRPELAVILCHGYGAPGTDLVPLGEELLAAKAQFAGRVRFYFPHAPLALTGGMAGGRAWWPIDVGELQRAIEFGEFRNLRGQQPELLADARRKLMQTLAAIQRECGLPTAKVVLGGFSQGAMLATDVTFHLPERPAALVGFSGTLLAESLWRERAGLKPNPADPLSDTDRARLAARWNGFRVVLSHGRIDPILPFAAAEWLRDLWQETGATVQFVDFHGPHTIPLRALSAAAELIDHALSAAP